MTRSTSFRRALLMVAASALILVALIPIAGARLGVVDRPATVTPAPALPAVPEQPEYKVSAGIDGEIFPAFANYASLQKPENRQLATVTVSVTNTTGAALHGRISVHVPGWSDQEIQYLDLPAGESRTLKFAPSFRGRLFRNHEIAAATAVVSATDLSGHPVFATTVPVRLRSADDMYWGSTFQFARYIASWVTPHDPQVEGVLAMAKEMAPGRRLPGYENWKSSNEQVHETYVQAQAIYRALQNRGLSYVKSSSTLGGHQGITERVRMPFESLRQVSANCIDGVVMYASLFENLGMDTQVVLVPGHAYVAVREAQNSDSYLYIDTALTARMSFEDSVLSASRGMKQWKPAQIIRVDIADARAAGIYPLPAPAAQRNPVMAADTNDD